MFYTGRKKSLTILFTRITRLTKLKPFTAIFISVPVGVLFAVSLIIPFLFNEKEILDILGIILIHTLVGIIIGLLMCLIWALPMHLLLTHYGLTGFSFYAFIGIFGGVIVWLIFSYPFTLLNLRSLEKSEPTNYVYVFTSNFRV